MSTGAEEERLSRLLWDCREAVDMLSDIVLGRTGRPDGILERLKEELDTYRAERGWPVGGFGGEGEGSDESADSA